MPDRSSLDPIATCLTFIALAAAVACAPKTGPDRFVGTFRWQQSFGYQAVDLEKGGKARYRLVATGDSTETETKPGSYRVVGDTAFLDLHWTGADTADATFTMLIRGDSLIMLNEVLGGNPVFMRER